MNWIVRVAVDLWILSGCPSGLAFEAEQSVRGAGTSAAGALAAAGAIAVDPAQRVGTAGQGVDPGWSVTAVQLDSTLYPRMDLAEVIWGQADDRTTADKAAWLIQMLPASGSETSVSVNYNQGPLTDTGLFPGDAPFPEEPQDGTTDLLLVRAEGFLEVPATGE